jgi:transcriptional antiterminator Rof (Rho-off)
MGSVKRGCIWSTLNCFPNGTNLQFFTSSSFHTYLALMGGYNLKITLSLDGYDLPAVANDFWMNFDWKSTTNCVLDGTNLQSFTSPSLHTYLALMGEYNLIITLSLDGCALPAVANDFWMNFDWKSTTNCALDGIKLQSFTSPSLHTYLALMGGYNSIITLSLDGCDLSAIENDFLINLNRNSMFYSY